MMRVIAGTARSLRLKTPEGLDTRPTADRIKETLFNMLQPYLGDAVFLDLFSGSGGIGIEALSRGARHAYFVENDRRALSCIVDNLKFTGFTQQATVMRQDAVSALYTVAERAVDIVYMDPPYERGYEKQILEALREFPWLTSDSLIVAEASLQTDFSYLEELGYVCEKEKRYKTNKHIFCRKR